MGIDGMKTSMADPILTIDHVSMKFGGLVAVNDLSFQVGRGEITALIGPNGAGKTTVFNCITGFYKPTEGMMTLKLKDGQQFLLERMPDFEVNKKARVARTFQNIRLFSGLTLLENLLVAQHNTLMRASGYTVLGLFGFSSYTKASNHSIEKARHWLDRIGLTDRADHPAGDLPYGAQRRLEIARAMCTEPELLCLDEPAAGLNPRESHELNTLLTAIPKETATSILLIEHDMSVVMEISDHVVVLEYGTKISDGTPKQVQSDPKVIAAYLGVDDDEAEAMLAKPTPVIMPNDVSLAMPLTTAEIATPSTTKATRTTPKATSPHVIKTSPVKTATEKAQGATTPAKVKSLPSQKEEKPAINASPKGKDINTTVMASAPMADVPDDLKRIKGIGPVNDAKLRAHGITTFKQIAAWKKADIITVEKYLEFDGRIAREDWMGQAKILAKTPTKTPAKTPAKTLAKTPAKPKTGGAK